MILYFVLVLLDAMIQTAYEILCLSFLIIYHVYSGIFETFFIFFILTTTLLLLILLILALFGVILRILLYIIFYYKFLLDLNLKNQGMPGFNFGMTHPKVSALTIELCCLPISKELY